MDEVTGGDVGIRIAAIKSHATIRITLQTLEQDLIKKVVPDL
jgi:hypothetical protein